MPKRIHVSRVDIGRIVLDSGEAHHARNVLRLQNGALVEVFDAMGASAPAMLTIERDSVSVDVERMHLPAEHPQMKICVFAAVPKGDRAEWMVEKLSELGVTALIPLEAERSVVVPRGTHKLERWTRIATESAKQCRRVGIMRIEPVTMLTEALASRRATRKAASDHSDAAAINGHETSAWFLSLERGAMSAGEALKMSGGVQALALFIGPEGGWSKQELEQMSTAGLLPVRLTNTILRIETAAVCAASIVMTCGASEDHPIGDGKNERPRPPLL